MAERGTRTLGGLSVATTPQVVHHGPPVSRGWEVRRPGRVTHGRMVLAERAVPRPAPGELLVRVLACGVCRTDLHLVEGDLPPHGLPRVPGHEAVGEVVAVADGADGADAAGGAGGTAGFRPGDLVGVSWVRSTCGRCRYCLRGDENLCASSAYTGWDADGGYAEHVTVPATFAHRLPPGRDPVELAPLLCAGIIGYRALARTEVPDGGHLGLYGFGASAHLTAQVAMARGCQVHVMTRSVRARALALDLGCASAGGTFDTPPALLDAAITFAPAGEVVPAALSALDRGGTLVVAGIHLTDVPPLRYQEHLFQERTLRSVTASTRQDARELLDLAARHTLRVATTAYPLEQADRALADLAADTVTGVAVLDLRDGAPAVHRRH